MPRLYLVRHGEAAAGWDADADPGLSAVGRRQAEAVGATLAGVGPLPIFTSPFRRCRDTAAPLARRWRVEPLVEPRVAEIPTPGGLGLGERGGWLAELMGGDWPADGALRTWCDGVIGGLVAMPSDAVVFTHFVAINVVIGRAIGDSRAVCARPGNCSVTVVDVDPADGTVQLVASPDEAETEVV